MSGKRLRAKERDLCLRGAGRALGQLMTLLSVLCLTSFTSPAAFGEKELIRNIEYAQPGDFALKCDMYLPDDGKRNGAAILMVHGGAWMSGNKAHVTRHARAASDAGYVVMAINYRLAPLHKFPAQIDDCRTALRWLRSKSDEYKFQPNQIAGYGYSAGAHLVCLLGMTADEPDLKLQAVVAGGTPTDFQKVRDDSRMMAYWLGGTPADVGEAYRAASPIVFASKDDPPVFLYHGTRDRVVPRANAESLARKLKRFQVPSEVHWVRGKGHIGAFMDTDAMDRAIAFLDQTLVKAQSAEGPRAKAETEPAANGNQGASLDDAPTSERE